MSENIVDNDIKSQVDNESTPALECSETDSVNMTDMTHHADTASCTSTEKDNPEINADESMVTVVTSIATEDHSSLCHKGSESEKLSENASDTGACDVENGATNNILINKDQTDIELPTSESEKIESDCDTHMDDISESNVPEIQLKTDDDADRILPTVDCAPNIEIDEHLDDTDLSLLGNAEPNVLASPVQQTSALLSLCAYSSSDEDEDEEEEDNETEKAFESFQIKSEPLSPEHLPSSITDESSNNNDDTDLSHLCQVKIEVLDEEVHLPTNKEYRKQGVVLDSDDSSSSDSDSDSDSSDCRDSKLQLELRSPLKTCDEISEELPLIDKLQISVPEDKVKPIGVVSNIIKNQVLIQARIGIPSIDLDTVLFLDSGRQCLGKVFDVFGPVTEPMYIILMNKEDYLSNAIVIGDTVYYAPTTEHTSYLILDELMKCKGSDASWKNDVEVPEDLVEYSDDEEAALAKRNRKRKIKNEVEVVQETVHIWDENPFNRFGQRPNQNRNQIPCNRQFSNSNSRSSFNGCQRPQYRPRFNSNRQQYNDSHNHRSWDRSTDTSYQPQNNSRENHQSSFNPQNNYINQPNLPSTSPHIYNSRHPIPSNSMFGGPPRFPTSGPLVNNYFSNSPNNYNGNSQQNFNMSHQTMPHDTTFGPPRHPSHFPNHPTPPHNYHQNAQPLHPPGTSEFVPSMSSTPCPPTNFPPPRHNFPPFNPTMNPSFRPHSNFNVPPHNR